MLKDADKARVRMIQNRISLWKNALVGPEQAAKIAEDDLEAGAAKVYVEYERTLRAYQAVDFDDLIRLPVNLFEERDDIGGRWRSRLWHLLVDECQDTNRCQYRMLQLLTGPRAAFTAVGDDDQSIYAWRGADIENLRLLRSDYPNLKVIKLEQNYRSVQRILKAANALIAHNPKLFEKKLWSEHGHGEMIRVTACRDGEHEAEWVVARLLAHKFENRTKFSDYAILYRGNFQAKAFEQQLRAHKIPYVLSGGQSFFDRSEIKDLTSYLRLLANQDDDPAFIRAVTTPKRGIGGTTLEALGTGRRPPPPEPVRRRLRPRRGKRGQARRSWPPCASSASSSTAWKHARRKSRPGRCWRTCCAPSATKPGCSRRWSRARPKRKWGNVRDFVQWLSAKGAEENKNLVELSQTVALISMLDKNEGEQDAVQLATLHAAKGLEFPHVFLVGIEEGVLPHRESIEAGKVEEERRLMYVGITRAQRSLTVTYCERRKQGREIVAREPSRFIVEMGEDIKHSGRDQAPAVTKDEGRAKLAAFRALLAPKA